MAERERKAAGWAAAAVLGMAGFALAQTASLKTAGSLERFLREASIVSVEKDTQGGRTLPWVVALEKDGVRARAIFKYGYRARPHPQAHNYRYELAAYELSKVLELEIVPPTVERTVEGVAGALQLFIEGCVSERDFARAGSRPPDPQALRNSLDTVRLLEALSGDSCGNKDDTYIHPDTWKACRVDFAEAFPPRPTLSEDCSIERCPRSLYERMLRMDPTSTKKSLKAWLSDDEIEALCGRKRQIVAGLMELIKSRGEAAVLYSPGPD
ncbi:MAG: hypothetical protein NTZ26_00750 [Candidatus Aminicenantes bacterium]|nr:hypothetical protein [Candidatus Aminicenantes bacterium]